MKFINEVYEEIRKAKEESKAEYIIYSDGRLQRQDMKMSTRGGNCHGKVWSRREKQ